MGLSGVRERQNYPRPPIVEALCQFHFAAPPRWNPATAGLVWATLKDEYPTEPEEQAQVEQGFSIDAEKPMASLQFKQSDSRLVYRNDSGDKLIVLNRASISANSLPPYEGWPDLRDRFDRALRATSSTLEVDAVSQVTLRYINRIGIPIAGREQVRTEEYFEMAMKDINRGSSVLSGLVQRYDAELMDEYRTAVSLIFAAAEVPGAERDDQLSFILDLEYRRVLPKPAPFDEAMMHASELKELENREFEDAITDRTRELFR